MKIKSLLLATATVLTCSQALALEYKMATSKSTTSVATGEAKRPPQIGSAYSAVDDIVLPTQCINGYATSVSHGASTTINYTNRSAYESILEDTKISGEVNYKGIYEASAYFNFISNVKNTRTRMSFVFKYDNVGIKHLFNATVQNGSLLSPLGITALQSDPTMGQFYRSCGNKVIDTVTTGGHLLVAMSVDFRTEYLKQHYEASGKVKDVIGVNNFKTAMEYIRKVYGESASIKLSAYQVGGNDTYVGELLSLVSGEKILNCTNSTSSVAECNKNIDNLYAYVSGPLAKSMKEEPTVLDFGAVSYSFVPEIGNNTYAIFPQEVIIARKQIAKALVEQATQKKEWQQILSMYDSYPPMLRLRWSDAMAQISAAVSTIDSNIANLIEASNVCHNVSAETIIAICASSASNALTNLTAPELPVKPYAVYDYGRHDVNPSRSPEKQCILPELTVLTGVAMRTKGTNTEGVRCWYRPLNEDGTLGAETYMQVGSGTEAEVRVPAGHVMTGYGFRVKDDNTKTAVAYYRKWDPVTRKLTGETKSVRGGSDSNNGLELEFNLAHGKVRGENINTHQLVMTGVGGAVKGDNADGLRVYLGWIE